jgi:hypothetical protein
MICPAAISEYEQYRRPYSVRPVRLPYPGNY